MSCGCLKDLRQVSQWNGLVAATLPLPPALLIALAVHFNSSSSTLFLVASFNPALHFPLQLLLSCAKLNQLLSSILHTHTHTHTHSLSLSLCRLLLLSFFYGAMLITYFLYLFVGLLDCIPEKYRHSLR